MLRDDLDGSPSQIMMDVDEENVSGQDSIQANILQNACAVINQLPVELLVTIISMITKDRQAKHPFICILFSGVCRHWRSVVLGTATFWKTIVFDGRTMTPDFLRELLRRSQTAPLQIIVERRAMPLVASMFWDGFAAVANCVKTLTFDTPDTLCFGDLMAFFPSLEYLFYRFSIVDSSFDIPCVQPHLKALQVSIGTLEGLAMPGRFPQLCWLHLAYAASIPWVPLLNALQSLPNLQVLHLDPSDGARSISEIRHPIVTLPELRVLVTYFDQITQLIHAPKLTHFHAENYPARYDNGHFSGFNFSRITRVDFTIGNLSSFYIDGYQNINMKGGFSFHHENINPIFDPIPVSYTNQFTISLEDLTLFDDEDTSTGGPKTFLLVFAACLKKTTNLVEMLLSGDGPPWDWWNRDELNSLFEALKCATSIHTLIIHWGLSFVTLCEILSDGTIFPHLEKITYYNDDENSQDLDFSDLHFLQKLVKERFVMLEIKLVGFPLVQLELLEQIGSLGIRLIQSQKLWV